MKNVLLPFAFSFLLPAVIYAQFSCNSGLLTNPSLEYGTPTAFDNDINNATGFSSIWASGNLADFYSSTQGQFAPNFIPTPATGNYISCWIDHNTRAKREGFKGEFSLPIPANSNWTYEFSFDRASLTGRGAVEIAIYGIRYYGVVPSAPSGAFTPDNEAFYGTGSTVLLETITIPANEANSNTKIRESFRFRTDGPNFPSAGITHFMITHSDNDNINGSRYIAFDNFCLEIPPCPHIDSAQATVICLGDIDCDGTDDYQIIFPNPSSGGGLSFDIYPYNAPGLLTIPYNQPNGSIALIVTELAPSANSVTFIYSGTNDAGDLCPPQMITIPLNPINECPPPTHCRKVQGQSPNSTLNAANIHTPDLNISPNPTRNDIQVSWDTKAVPKEISISIFNTSGIEVRRLERINGHEGAAHFDLENLASGLYFIKVLGANYTPAPIKFVKQN